MNIKKIIFVIILLFFLFSLLTLNSCAINPLFLKSPEKLEKYSRLKPLLPYFYIYHLKFSGLVVIDKKIDGIPIPPLNITFDYIKNNILKLNFNINTMFKTVSFAQVYFDFVKMKGYIKSSYNLYYKEIDSNFLKSLSPYLNRFTLLKGINTLFLLFDKNQKELLEKKQRIVSQLFNYYKEGDYINKIGFNIPEIQIEINYKNNKMVDTILKYPFYIEGTYYKNRIAEINFKIIIKKIDVDYKFDNNF